MPSGQVTSLWIGKLGSWVGRDGGGLVAEGRKAAGSNGVLATPAVCVWACYWSLKDPACCWRSGVLSPTLGVCGRIQWLDDCSCPSLSKCSARVGFLSFAPVPVFVIHIGQIRQKISNIWEILCKVSENSSWSSSCPSEATLCWKGPNQEAKYASSEPVSSWGPCVVVQSMRV